MSEYLLSDSFENDQQQETMYEDINSATALRYNTKEKKKTTYIPKLNIFSSLLTLTQGFTYDHPEVLKQFPNGFVTENIFFINDYITKTRLPVNENINSNVSTIAFISNLTTIIENKYNVQFSDKEMASIFSDVFSKEGDSTHYINLYQQHNVKPDFISNQDMYDLCIKLDISSAPYFKNAGIANNYIDTILKDSAEVNNPNHPFSKLKSLIKDVAITPTELSFDNVTTIVSHPGNPDKIKSVFDSIKISTENALNNSTTLEQFISIFKQDIVPTLLVLADHHFLTGIQNLKSQLNNSNKDYLGSEFKNSDGISTKAKELIGKSLTTYNDGYLYITEEKRDLLIKSITNYDALHGVREDFIVRNTAKRPRATVEETSTPKLN